MAVYSYPESHVIDEITFRKTENGSLRAYLHAKEGADTTQLLNLRKDLKAKEIDSIRVEFNDKPTVEVRGFKKEKDLLDLLKQKNTINGKNRFVKEAEDTISFQDKFRKNTLPISGAIMTAADTSYLGYGVMEGSKANTAAGAAYIAGSTILGTYGRSDPSRKQLHDGAAMLLKHARETGLTIPEDSAAVAITRQKPKNVLQKIDGFLRERPAEAGNMSYFLAGSLVAFSALKDRVFARPRAGMTAKQISEQWQAGLGDTALGASTMTAGLIATFGKEKKLDPDRPRKKGLARIPEWLGELSPMAKASTLYIGSTLCHAWTTFKETAEAMRIKRENIAPHEELVEAGKKLKAIPFRIFFVLATIAGELLLAVSSKGHGDGVVNDKSINTGIIAMAAELIAAQPVQMQEQRVEEMAKFLGRPDVLALKDDKMAGKLRKQLESIKKNPWGSLTMVEKAAPMPAATPATPIPAPDTIAFHQARLAAEPPRSLSRAGAAA